MIKSQAHQLAPVLKAIYKEILELAGVGSAEKGREVYLHTTPHSLSEYKADKRQHQENTQFGDFLTAVVSGVIFQVIGVSFWTEVNHIRMSSSRMFCFKEKVINWESFTGGKTFERRIQYKVHNLQQ